MAKRKTNSPTPPLLVAEVGAFKRLSPEDRIRRTAALIAILEIDQDFAALKKTFEAINLVDGRDFLEDTDTYDIVIVHSVLSPQVNRAHMPTHIKPELMTSPHHDIQNWKNRLVSTEAKYIVVCEGQPYTLSGWELGKLPGYTKVKGDQWLTVYQLKT